MDLGLERAGFTPLWMCEIDRPCREVLRLHWPTVPIHQDMLALNTSNIEHPDILCGGTPCQGFSFAGLRQSLDDDRSNLCLHFVKLANELNPRLILWENVPGVLSSKDNAFGCFLGALVGADAPLVPPRTIGRWNKGKDGEFFSWTSAGMVIGPKRRAAWRVLDSQYFGVAQRRERVFVVCDTGDGSAEQILFEQDGVRRYSPPIREEGEAVAPTLRGGTHSGSNEPGNKLVQAVAGTLGAHKTGGWGNDLDNQGAFIPVQIANNTGAGYWTEGQIAGCLRSSEAPTQPQTIIGFDRTRGTVTGDKSATLRGCSMKDGEKDAGGGTQCAMVPRILASIKTAQTSSNGIGIDETGLSYTLDGAQGQAVAYRTSGNDGVRCQGDKTGALNTGTDQTQNIIAFQPGNLTRGGGSEPSKEIFPTLSSEAHAGDQAPHVSNGYAVRRLTPLECSRLQGFPDLWNLHAITDKDVIYDQKDSPRYKQYGNAVTVNVLEWLGKRIKKHGLKP